MYEGRGLTHARVESEMMNLGQGCSWENRFQGKERSWERHLGQVDFFFFFWFNFSKKIYLFMVALGLHCHPRVFSSCSKQGQLIMVRGLLIAVSFLVVEHGP